MSLILTEYPKFMALSQTKHRLLNTKVILF